MEKHYIGQTTSHLFGSDYIKFIAFTINNATIITPNKTIDHYRFEEVLEFRFKDAVIQTESVFSWHIIFAKSILDYAETLFTKEEINSGLQPTDCGYEIFIDTNFPKTNAIKIVLDYANGKFEYYDEFGLALSDKSIHYFLKKLNELHPGIKIPRLAYRTITN